MAQPEIAILMSTYQRPGHLRRALESVRCQQGVDGRMELVVTDDGSTDETQQVVENFAKSVPFRVAFTTHPHTTFRLSRSRNEGVRASSAPYLLFVDGDCILPPDHVKAHLERRKPGVVMAGDCCRIDEPTSEDINVATIAEGRFERFASSAELARLRKLDRASRFYRLIRHPSKPKIIGYNVALWRADYDRVNGYDENFEGWGCEDDDLRLRLRKAGVHIESILRWTWAYHLWHPTDVTTPINWREGRNVQYLLRPGRLTQCCNGLRKRTWNDLRVHVVAENTSPPAGVEVEVLVLPGPGRFSNKAECNVLVARDEHATRLPAAREAHLTIVRKSASESAIDQGEIEQALRMAAWFALRPA